VSSTWPVTHRCGHLVGWDLSKKHPEDRASYARWLAGRDCTRCWWANRRHPHDTRRTDRQQMRDVLAVIVWEQANGMPILCGRPRTVAYARKLRHQLLATTFQPEAVLAAARRVTTAKWWIAHRQLDSTSLAAALRHSAGRTNGRRRPDPARP
jgi:hypothetical protein